jgi:hypothetical protein
MAMNGEITLVSNKGSGSTRKVKIASGANASEILAGEMGVEVDPEKYSVWVNGKSCTDLRNTPLGNGDFVIITPRNLKGAA